MRVESPLPSIYYLLFSYVAGLLLQKAGLFFLLPALLLLCRASRSAKGLGWCLMMVCIGAANVVLTDPLLDARHYRNAGTESYVALALCQEPEERARTFRAKAKMLATGNDTLWQQRSGYVQCYFSKDSGFSLPRYGDTVFTWALLRPVEGFVGKDSVYFDYGAFMARKGIYAQMFLSKDNCRISTAVGLSVGKRFRRSAGTLRTRLRSFWNNCGFDNRELAVAKALILGERGTDPIEEAYRKSGIIHVLAVSGMHLSIFSCMAAAALSFLKRKAWQRWLRFFLMLVPVWGYAVLTGLSPSVCRAAYMFTVVGLGDCMGKGVKTTRSLAISAFILLVASPGLLQDMGFLLSYTAVIGLTLFSPVLGGGGKEGGRIRRFFKDLTVASLSAQLATLPIILCVFGNFPTYFLVGNCLVAPLVNIALPFGIQISLLSLAFPVAAALLAKPMELLLRFMNFAVETIGNLPASVADLSISILGASLLYGCIFFLLQSARKRSAGCLQQAMILLLLVLWIG